MLRILFSIVLSCVMLSAQGAIQGGVTKNDTLTNQVIDSNSGQAISNAKVAIPALKFQTITDEDGRFNLNANINAPTILSVQKDGYRPFSMTIDKNQQTPLIIGIEKSAPKDIVVETDMIHLGDNSYSVNSANAGDFASKSIGAFYSKDFFIPKVASNKNIILKIGSVIGVDTILAQQFGQSKVVTTYASPPEIYCNGNKICEINLNGDNQKISIPKGIVKQNTKNTITIKSGKNMLQTAYIDYDDIEFSNISIEIE